MEPDLHAHGIGHDLPSQDSFLGRAVRYMEQHRFAAAEATCKAILAHDPAQIEAQVLLGLALGAQEAPAAAAPWLDRAARARPTAPHPCHALTGLLQEIGLERAIIPQYRASLRLAPRAASLSEALAEQLHLARDFSGALEALRPLLLAAEPTLSVLMRAGTLLANLARFEEAAEMFRAVVTRDPGVAQGWSNLGMMLKVQAKFDAALDAADRAVALCGDDPQIRLNRAMILLRAGRLAEAWDDYDARLALPGRSPLPAESLLRDIGQINAEARPTVLVLHDCGFGDTLNFVRFVRDLGARGAHVVAWMPEPLVALISRAPGVAQVVRADEPAPPFDFHCQATDLPRVCRATLETISDAPYLAAEPAAAARWRRRLGQAEGLRVGLAWAGQARPWLEDFDVLDSRRSMTLDRLAPLTRVPNVQWISLQKGEPAAQAAHPPPGMELLDLTDELHDFAETAALIANLDAVVTVDTSVAHLAGATGTRVLLLDRYDGCWRWFHGREDSPWYRGLRILRQPAPGAWGPVVERVAELLSEFTGQRAAAGSEADSRGVGRPTRQRQLAQWGTLARPYRVAGLPVG